MVFSREAYVKCELYRAIPFGLSSLEIAHSKGKTVLMESPQKKRPQNFFLSLLMRNMRDTVMRLIYAHAKLTDVRRTILPGKVLTQIQRGAHNYEYRGIRCIKNPFDLAIYLKVLWEMKPRTIFEIGSASGGSAKFFADQTAVLGLDTMVYSFDIKAVKGLDEDRLRFFEADIHNLEKSAIPDLLRHAERPILVIDDGPHTFEGCRASLEFFHPFLSPGDQFVVEDGNLRDLGYLEYQDGPNRAIKEFLGKRGGDYEIAYDYCDTFGQNATWNTDGYLRRVR